MNRLLHALRFFKPDRSRIAGVMALLLLSVGLNLLKPWPLAWLVDSIAKERRLPLGLAELDRSTQIIILSSALLALSWLQGTLFATQSYFGITVGLRGLRRVRETFFACLQRLSLRYHQGTKAGDLIHRASWDTYSFQTLFQQGVLGMANAILSLGLMTIVMSRLNPTLTLTALGVAPLLLLTIRLVGRRMREGGAAAQESDGQVTSFVQQTISALPWIQSYTREAREQSRFAVRAGDAESSRRRQHKWEVIYGLGIAVVFGMGTAATIWIGCREVVGGRLTIGELLVFLAYLAQLYEPLNQLSHVGATVTTAGAGVARVFEVLDAPEEVRDLPDPKAFPFPSNDRARDAALAFDAVTFAYDPSRPVLQQVSFQVAPGESVGLIGPSGAGKTTLLNLLPRFFDPTAGAVRWNGIDLRELRLAELRARVAWVSQEPMLMAATAAENIAYAKPDASPAEIEAAARAAHCHVFIERLPQGYETRLGEGGARLSVGEKQRLNLARAFLKDAPLLLLDEPTSALDAESETLVLASLTELMKDRTTLVVAHRLHTVQQLKTILILQDGRLVEKGAPAELLGRDTYFARMAAAGTR